MKALILYGLVFGPILFCLFLWARQTPPDSRSHFDPHGW